MCLSREEVNNKMVRWGDWQWLNKGYAGSQGYSSDGKMYHINLKTGACGGGNKIENFEEMPDDVAVTDALLSQIGPDHFLLCNLMYVVKDSAGHTMKSRAANAKLHYVKIPPLPSALDKLPSYVKKYCLFPKELGIDSSSEGELLGILDSIRKNKNNFRKTLDVYNRDVRSLWCVLESILDIPNISKMHPYRKKSLYSCN